MSTFLQFSFRLSQINSWTDLAREPKKTAERIIEETLGAWGRLNLLVNNASQFYSSKVENVTEEEWHGNMNSNLSALFFLSKGKPFLFHSRWDKQMTNLLSCPLNAAPVN